MLDLDGPQIEKTFHEIFSVHDYLPNLMSIGFLMGRWVTGLVFLSSEVAASRDFAARLVEDAEALECICARAMSLACFASAICLRPSRKQVDSHRRSDRGTPIVAAVARF